jgi:hypothetical protein
MWLRIHMNLKSLWEAFDFESNLYYYFKTSSYSSLSLLGIFYMLSHELLNFISIHFLLYSMHTLVLPSNLFLLNSSSVISYI